MSASGNTTRSVREAHKTWGRRGQVSGPGQRKGSEVSSLWHGGREIREEGLRRGETCRGGRGRRSDGMDLREARSHSPRSTRASRVCSVGAGELASAGTIRGHVSRAIEGQDEPTAVLPVRVDFEETELGDLTSRANWEKCVRTTRVRHERG